MGQTVLCTKQSVAETHVQSLCRVLLCGVLLSLIAAGQWLSTFSCGEVCNRHGSVQSRVPSSTLPTPLTLPATGKTVDSTQRSHLVFSAPRISCDYVNSVVTLTVIMQGLADHQQGFIDTITILKV